MRDLANHITVKRAISPAAADADNTPLVSQIVDLGGFDTAMFAINTGVLSDTDATFAVTMDHGDDSALADAAPVPAIKLTGTLAQAGFTFNDDNAVRKIGYVGGKQFVRLTITPTGNSAGAFVSAVAIGGPRHASCLVGEARQGGSRWNRRGREARDPGPAAPDRSPHRHLHPRVHAVPGRPRRRAHARGDHGRIPHLTPRLTENPDARYLCRRRRWRAASDRD